VKLCESQIIDLSGQTDIPLLTGVLSGARLVISNDTGPAHIAAALNVPVIVIFGPTNPARISPYNKPHAAVAVDADSRGNAIESSDVRHRIEAVTIDSVYAEVEYHLKDRAR
jgi:ADP-heptose:LPS heptosyltransferase